METPDLLKVINMFGQIIKTSFTLFLFKTDGAVKQTRDRT